MAADSVQYPNQGVPDDVLKEKIIPYIHEPILRGVNKLFRDNLVIHLNHPMLLSKKSSKKGWQKKQQFLREMLRNGALVMNDYWVFDRFFSADFFQDAVKTQSVVKLKVIRNESHSSDDFFNTCYYIGVLCGHNGVAYDEKATMHEIIIKRREKDEKSNKCFCCDVIPGAGFIKLR